MIFYIQHIHVNIEDQGQQHAGDIELHQIGATNDTLA
jgi:hypothetical protein